LLYSILTSSIAPWDLIKIRQQGVLPGHHSPYRNCYHAVAVIYRNEGIKGLYRGVGATVARATVVTATQLSTYDHAKHTLIETPYFEDNFVTHFSSSLIAGFCTALASNPVDVVKTRYMNAPKGTYSSALECFMKTLRHEGVRALYKGFAPNYIRIGSHCMLTFPLYEQVRKLLGLTTI
jgi:hypothetical protein